MTILNSTPQSTLRKDQQLARTIRRGEIYFISRGKGGVTGSEMYSGRPALIVSNDVMNKSSNVVSVVYLRRNIGSKGPIHVDLGKLIDDSHSIAACEQVFAVDVSRVGDHITTVSEAKMLEVNDALHYSLGLQN